MATTLRMSIFLVAIIFCAGPSQVLGELDELSSEISRLESMQQSMTESMQSLEEQHSDDINSLTQMYQEMQGSVNAQKELLEEIQQSLDENGIPGGNGNGGDSNEEEGGQDRSGPCHPDNYETIDDPRRAIGGEYSGYDHLCDRDITPGWKRFMLNGDSAVIPTHCVEERHCHTHAPTWVDLQGESLPGVGQEVEARACSHWSSDCCNWSADITVRNCGDYYVYNVSQLSACSLSFCAEPQ